MTNLHFIAKLYNPATGEYLGKYDLIFNEIVGQEEENEDDKVEVEHENTK